MSESLFEYQYLNNNASKTLFLFHGTGGTKEDFLFLNSALKDTYNLVGLQGNILENGMPRFFKRFTTTVFDQENIKVETDKLNTFISDWNQNHKLETKNATFLGYSNGANFLVAFLINHPDKIQNAVLLHALLPVPLPIPNPNVAQAKLLLTAGKNDQMIPYAKQLELKETLASVGAQITFKEYPGGHEISSDELKDIISYLTLIIG